ncbi:MAG TPA: glycosyltransferase [Dehalococcoidia bacterium]|nr:glycosyltransferase [Dehalococcoidia bacterium]
MLGSVPTTPKSLEDYRPIIGDERTDEILRLGDQLRGARVLHVNATAFGGGVAEILGTMVPLMNDAGLDADWQVIKGADDFFNITKAMHNSLQGMYYDWTPEKRETWLDYNRMNAELFDGSYDFVIIHDPQPAPILSFLEQRTGERSGKWIWRCHIDLTDAQPPVWDLLRTYVERYDAAIFTLPDYVKDDLRGPQIFCVPPAIDPLSPKNMPLPAETVDQILERYSVDPRRPMITQISRFDPWKDPLGVIDVYRAVKAEVPDLQLVMVASMASDDPEAWDWYERTVRRAGEDYEIHVLSNLQGVGNLEVNAFQRAAKVVVQKSVREGFGLVVSEALWKARPVVAGNVGGIPLQIVNGKTGFLVNSTEECTEKVLFLLRNEKEAARMGERGAEYVRDNFLMTRYLRDYLRIFCQLSGREGAAPPHPIQAGRAPG